MGKVLSAEGSGYFPKCIEQVESISSGLKGSLVNMMQIYWRVKKWRASLSGTASFFGNGVTFFGTEFDIPNRFGEKTEENLICSPFVDFLSENVPVGNLRDLLGDNPIDGRYRIFINMTGNLVAQKEAGNVYSYPNLVTCGLLYPGMGNLSLSASTPSQTQNVGSWSMSLYGGSLGGTLYKVGGAGNFDNPQFVLAITVSEYYSYGGTYNTQTGAPL
jgi:hypothetical protein